jgi:hypothetical protein
MSSGAGRDVSIQRCQVPALGGSGGAAERRCEGGYERREGRLIYLFGGLAAARALKEGKKSAFSRKKSGEPVGKKGT